MSGTQGLATPGAEGGGWEGHSATVTYSTLLHSANISRSLNFTHFHLYCLPRTSTEYHRSGPDWNRTLENTGPVIVFYSFLTLGLIGSRAPGLNLIL